ncbi:hypothetical protein J6590_050143 [Homalodisca vitripennis]|nr:hypothetical protein J6590_050143 [Homalodisca vitripennis]
MDKPSIKGVLSYTAAGGVIVRSANSVVPRTAYRYISGLKWVTIAGQMWHGGRLFTSGPPLF